MERKVMKQGPSTLVVSLPSKWTKKYQIKKGSSLFIEEKGNNLTIKKQPEKSETKITVDVTETLPMTHRIVGALYKAGYDEMSIKYGTSQEAKAILETAQFMQGHQVMKHEKNIISIQRIMNMDTESFEAMYRKCFHMVQEMAQETKKALKTNDREKMKEVILKDNLMAVFADYSRRMLLLGYGEEHIAEQYHIAVQLEKIADRFKYLCRWYSESHEKPSKEIQELIEDISEFTALFEELYYNFSTQKAVNFGKERRKIEKKEEEIMTNVQKKEMKPLFYCMSIRSLLFDLNGPLLEMKTKEF